MVSRNAMVRHRELERSALASAREWATRGARADFSMVAAISAGFVCLLCVPCHAQAPVYPITVPSQVAKPPVSLRRFGTLLHQELASEQATGELRPGSNVGIVVGVVLHGKRRIFTYGTAKADSIFEIGSLTKTFTGTVLAQRVAQGAVRLDEPVRDLLPSGTVSGSSGDPEITLLSLSDHHSGLPNFPDNLQPADPNDPFADYRAAQLYSYVKKRGVGQPENAPFSYSSTGAGLLGLALANQAEQSFPALLKAEVLAPLGMLHTAFKLDAAQQRNLIQGHTPDHQPAKAWNLDGLASAGGLRSDARDLLTFLEVQLHPEQVDTSADPYAKTLPDAIRMTHVVHAEAFQGMHIALNWFRQDSDGSFWHGGGTGGYSSFALFNQKDDFAVIVLCNTSYERNGLTDQLGELITQRLEGIPAIALRGTE